MTRALGSQVFPLKAMGSRIEDYAIIGDCQTAALITREATIDWLCLPRFDSGACFAALLGDQKRGTWQIAPAGEIKTSRRHYRKDTLVLETDYETAKGTVTVIDCMPPRSKEVDIVRVVVGKSGRVPIRMQLIIRFVYGSVVTWVRRTKNGMTAIAGPDALILRTSTEVHGQDFRTIAEFTVSEGERIPFVLVRHPSHTDEPIASDAEEMICHTEEWWKVWANRCTYQGPWRDAVLRSLITLKALTFAPTGGVVAAPTTSLPEQINGARNWDYRYCWVRDATFTLYALLLAGYTEEACAWREWLLRAVPGEPSELNIMYGLFGERRLPEMELSWLSGYEGSQPVRIGNAAATQYQLDVYGELMDALHVARRSGIKPDENAWRVQLALIDYLESAWHDADNGIWEMRGPQHHFTHSKMMAWVAFDRMIKSVERFGLSGPVERWRKCRQTIHDEVCRHVIDSAQNSFVQFYGSTELDASLLMMPLVGFLPADDPRIEGTVQAIRRNLVIDGLVMRYRSNSGVDGLPDGEGVFLACSFWLVDNLAMLGNSRIDQRAKRIKTDQGNILYPCWNITVATRSKRNPGRHAWSSF